MRKATIVIGCSYGDEGKGLAAAHAARRAGDRCLNVLINGGAQRGHTVEFPDGRRHVFHHFGSGTFSGAVSCADEDFILNPMLYWEERDALALRFGVRPRLMACTRCRVTLPWDMMLGQIIEENRGEGRYGSCGCGIFETRLRYEDTTWAADLAALNAMCWQDFRAYCARVAQEYLPQRIAQLGMSIPAHWQAILREEAVAARAWDDLRAMLQEVELYSDWAAAARPFPCLVFEAGQGLALDENNLADFPHLTPSSTTSLISARRIAALGEPCDVQVMYVTRTYLTRHGAGPLPTECPKEAINPAMTDLTNVPNPHQQALRYGRFDGGAVLARVQADITRTRQILPDARAAVLVTHLNETGGKLCGDMPLEAFTAHFDEALYSAAPGRIGLQDG